MNNKYSILAMLLVVLTMMTSCLSDDTDDATYYDDAAVSSFSLGTLKRIMHTKTKYTDEDSTYSTTVSCSSYAFTIDQDNGLIYNVDSLPVGTVTEKALVTISAVNSGYVYLKSYTSDSLTYYSSSTDSLDFSQPRTMRVYANDGSCCKDYVVDVRVHKETSDSLYWNAKSTSAELAKLSDMRGLAFDGKLYVYGTTDSKMKAYSSTDGNSWTEVAIPECQSMSVATDGSALYALADGSIYNILDGNTIATNTSLKTLAGASHSEVYAISNDGHLMKSMDKCITWTQESVDGDEAYLPAQEINSICSPIMTNTDIDKVVLIGNRGVAADSTCVVWSKTVDNSSAADTQQWLYQPFLPETWHYGPSLNHLTVAAYDGGLVMIGGKGVGACSDEAFSTIYFSKDCGMNWWSDSRFYLPSGFDTTDENFAFFSDSSNYLWLISGSGKVWRGYISQLVWE